MTHIRTDAAGASTTAQLKADIDAGHPASPARIDLARRTETRIGARAGQPVRDSTSRSGVSIGLMVGVVAVFAVVILAVVFFR